MSKIKKILIVDDDEAILSLLEKNLKRKLNDIEVQCAIDGVSASQEIEINKYDLIITDLNLPRKTGHSFLKRIKFSKHNADTPLVVLTGYPDDQLVREYAPIYQVAKPFQYKDVVSLAKDLLEIDKRQLRNHHDVFQAFLIGLERICHKRGVEMHNVSQPWIRPDGHNLSGYLHLFFDFEIEKNLSSFNISLEKDVLSRLYLEYTGKPIQENENCYLVMGDEILKILFAELSDFLTNMDCKSPKMVNQGSFIGSESAQCLKAQQQKGFYIDILTSIGNIHIQTLIDPLMAKALIA